MFSWIIEFKAKILHIDKGRFTIENNFKDALNIGQSIAHDGACMTIETCDNKSYTFFVMKESLKKTNFDLKKAGDFFNVERCLKIWDRLDWHFVSGHIDCTGKVKKIKIEKDTSWILHIKFPKKMRKYLIEKWSITINWVSLTLVEIKKESFSVSLIPLTQKITNLGILKEKDIVNLEFDLIGKYVLNKK